MWQEHQKSGMQAFINGDNDGAIDHWKNAAAAAAESGVTPTPELAELYYCLGKALADAQRDQEAMDYLRPAVEMLTQFSPGDQKLKVAQYALAEVLNRNGGEEEATAQFKQAYDLPEHVCFAPIPLGDALKALRDHGLAAELQGGVLSSHAKNCEIDKDGDNERICDLLIEYYLDETHGDRRLEQDRFFVMPYTEFDTEIVLDVLSMIAEEQDLLSLVEQQGETADGDYIYLTLKTRGGELVSRACSSVVGIVDEFNAQLEAIGVTKRFCGLNSQGCFAAYFMEPAVQASLYEARAIPFDEIG